MHFSGSALHNEYAQALAAPRDGLYKRGHCFLLEHELFGKPLSTPDQIRGGLFPGHALIHLHVQLPHEPGVFLGIRAGNGGEP